MLYNSDPGFELNINGSTEKYSTSYCWANEKFLKWTKKQKNNVKLIEMEDFMFTVSHGLPDGTQVFKPETDAR